MRAIEVPKSLVEQVYEVVLDAISVGSLRPGERLNQDDLARKLDVSRQPLNSALERLKAEGFVETTGRRGVVVAPIDNKLSEAIYEFRTAVDPLAVRLATARIDAQAIAAAREIITRGKNMVAAGDAAQVVQADIDFHLWIYQLSGNPIIVATMERNWRHLRRSMSEVLRSPGMSRQVWIEHQRILDSMTKGNADMAADLMLKHILGAPERLGLSAGRPQGAKTARSKNA